MVPNSLTDPEALPDTRLSTLINKARSRDRQAYLRERDHAKVNRAFSDIATAVERGRRHLDPKSADAEVLAEVDNALKWR